MRNEKRGASQKRHEFLLETFFPESLPKYSSKEVGRFTLVKQWNGNVNEWEVAIWDTESFKKTKEYYYNNFITQQSI
jgi:hypothetical protein